MELAALIGSYLTAGVALAVAVFTTWSSQRHWEKRFRIEKSYDLGRERVRLLEEVPRRLMEAHLLALNMQNSHAQTELLTYYYLSLRPPLETEQQQSEEMQSLLLDVRRSVDDEHAKMAQANELLQAKMQELFVLRITLRVYFDDRTGKALESALEALKSFSLPMPEYAVSREDLDEFVRAMSEGATDSNQVLIKFVNDRLAKIRPAIEGSNDQIFHVVQCMADYMERQAA